MPAYSSQVADRLRTALAQPLDGLSARQTTTAVDRLMTHYRGRTPTGSPVLRDRSDAVAYAAYRMPATFAAVSAALRALAARLPGWAPASQLDAGGGTGAAVWAAHAVWGGLPAHPEAGARSSTVLDWSEPALALGRELAGAGPEPLHRTRWQRQRISGDLHLPATDLITAGYLLGELTEADRRTLVEAAARAGQVVVLVEPGTPEGYRRIREARDRLIAAGLRVLAPCPHSDRCPLVEGDDWCHFGVRVNRTSLHRQVKGGSLPYEDEKYAYVAAVRPALTVSSPGVPGAGPADAEPAGTVSAEPGPAAGRVVRRPRQRKGQVLLEVCERGGGLRSVTVTKRQGAHYRAARETDWGDLWPPS